jgi:hypothetical protein
MNRAPVVALSFGYLLKIRLALALLLIEHLFVLLIT